ncbi:MAG: GC-type dockerin domain-anchored protein [Phycisphaerales bacterium]
MKRSVLTLAVVGLFAFPASAQSFNVEWGSPDTAPPASYAGVGLAGVWNTFESMASGVDLPLVGLDGAPIAVTIRNIGFDVVESFDNPGTSGADQALLDDCFVSYNDPVDGCLFMKHVAPGDYRVIMYALAPDDALLKSRLRIDQNLDDPELVGGAWPGAHQEGVTYMRQNATVAADGILNIHSGLFGGEIRSVLNGIQVVRLADLCPADLAEPMGQLDFSDVVAFLVAFSAMAPEADLAMPFGQWDFSDVVEFLTIFGSGCP